VYKLSLLFECDYKKLVKAIADYTLKKKRSHPKKANKVWDNKVKATEFCFGGFFICVGKGLTV